MKTISESLKARMDFVNKTIRDAEEYLQENCWFDVDKGELSFERLPNGTRRILYINGRPLADQKFDVRLEMYEKVADLVNTAQDWAERKLSKLDEDMESVGNE